MHKLVYFAVLSHKTVYFETFTSALYVLKFSKYLLIHMYHIKLFEFYPLILNAALKCKNISCCRIPTAKFKN